MTDRVQPVAEENEISEWAKEIKERVKKLNKGYNFDEILEEAKSEIREKRDEAYETIDNEMAWAFYNTYNSWCDIGAKYVNRRIDSLQQRKE